MCKTRFLHSITFFLLLSYLIGTGGELKKPASAGFGKVAIRVGLKRVSRTAHFKVKVGAG